MSEEFAELVGVLLGDGSLNMYASEKYSTYYRIKVTLHAQETQYIRYVAKLLTSVLGAEPHIRVRKEEQATDILVFKKKCVLYLLAQGLVSSPKWGRARIPRSCMNTRFGRLVLRGYFDTDGCVVITDNNGRVYPRLEMKISPGPFQKQLLALLSDYSFRFGVYDIGRGKVRVQLNGVQQLLAWNNTIGFSNEKHSAKVKLFME